MAHWQDMYLQENRVLKEFIGCRVLGVQVKDWGPVRIPPAFFTFADLLIGIKPQKHFKDGDLAPIKESLE
jgi:hypothetical protein